MTEFFQPLRKTVQEQIAWASSDHPRIGLGYSMFDAATGGGAAPGELIQFLARSGVGKCIVGESRVLLSDGSYAPIEEIGDDEVVSWDGKKFTTSPAVWIPDGVKDTVVLTTKHGRRIRTTYSHPYLTPDGWTPVADLKVGDEIAIPQHIPLFGSVTVPSHVSGFVGLYLAKGTGTNSSPQITTSSYRSAIEKWAREFQCTVTFSESAGRTPTYRVVGAEGKGSGSPGGNKAKTLLEDLGITGRRAGEKEIPQEAFTWDRDSVANMVRWMFNGDGWLCNRPKGHQLGYCSKSERLIRDLDHLLTRFGIFGYVKYKPNAHGGAWTWTCQKASDIRRFMSHIGIDRPAAKDIRGCGGDPEPDPLVFDPIVSIDRAAPARVYDLSVAGHHNFVAENILAHNTTFALNVLNNVSYFQKQPAVFFSLEMQGRAVVNRLAAIHYDVSTARIERDLKTEKRSEHLDYLDRDFPHLAIVDKSSMTFRQMGKALEEAAEVWRRPVRFAAVDYAELIGGVRALDGAGQVDQVMKAAKNFARDHDVVLMVLHQVSRGAGEQGHRPLSATSGRFGGEQAADYILAAFRPHMNPEIQSQGQGAVDAAKKEFWLQFLKTRSGHQLHESGVPHNYNPASMRITERQAFQEEMF